MRKVLRFAQNTSTGQRVVTAGEYVARNMKHQFLESGEIVNTHGIRGEVKIIPWCDTPEFLCAVRTLYIGGVPVKAALRAAGKHVLAKLDGVDDVQSAMRYKGKVVSIDRADVTLPEGRHFIADLIGLEVRDTDSGAVLGTLAEVFETPAHNIYVVKGEKTYFIPAVDAFLRETNLDRGYISVHTIEGMGE